MTKRDDIVLSRAWLWARECAYLRHLLRSLRNTLNADIQIIAPAPHPLELVAWHGSIDIPVQVLAELSTEDLPVHWIPTASPRRPPDPPILLPIASFPPDGDWILVSAFGIPDLAYHLEKLAGREKTPILVLLDSHESGPHHPLAELSRKIGSKVRYLDIPSEDNTSSPEETIDCFLHKPLVALYLKILAPFFSRTPPTKIIVSDHDCAQSRALRTLYTQTGSTSPVCVYAHSAWPLEPPFVVPRHENWKHFPATNSGLRALIRTNTPVGPTIIPSPRYKITIRRIARQIIRLAKPRPPAAIRIGVVVTSGEGIFAPDEPILQIADTLSSLLAVPAPLRPSVTLHVRLRQNEDHRDVLASLLPDTAQPASWSTSGDSTIGDFLRSVDMIVEVGTHGSIMLESFAEMVPFARIGPPSRRRQDFGSPSTLLLTSGTPWDQLSPFVMHRYKRVLLSLRQLYALFRDTVW